MRATGESASEHRSQTTVPYARMRVFSFIYLVTNVNVVVVVRQREGRATEAEQRDDLPRLHLGREQQDVSHCPLGDRAVRLLVPEDGAATQRGDVGGEPIDVRRDDAWARIEPVPADQARHGRLTVRLG